MQPLRNSQAQRGDLRFDAPGHRVDPWRRRLAVGGNTEGREPFYHRAFDGPDHRADAQLAPAQIAQQIHDELAGPVIRDLAAAVDLHRRNAVVAQQMLAPSGEPERVDGRMLGEPDLVRRVGRARGRECLHRAPRGHVLGAP